MKKLTALLLSAALLCGCGSSEQEAASTSSAAASSPSGNNAGAINLNTEEADISGYVFLSDSDPAFVEINMEESFRLVEEGGTGLIFYSYEDCPWCNRAVPILNQAAKEEGVTIFYDNIYDDWFMSKTKDEKEALVNKLYEVMEPALDTVTDEETGETSPVLRVPLVVAVKDGEIIGHHRGVVDSFELDEDRLDEFQVTDDQKEELLNIYKELIEETYA
jgi:hypothetical protein